MFEARGLRQISTIGPPSSSEWSLLYAVIGLLVVVIVLLIVMMMGRKRLESLPPPA
jgi:hypothetical protein